MRAPTVSLFFFLAAAGLIMAAFWSTQTPNEDRPYTDQTLAQKSESDHTSNPENQPQPLSNRKDRIARAALDWPTEPNYTSGFNALDPTIDIAAVQPSAFDPADEYFGLARSPGYDLVFAYCSSCHSLRIVMQQHATAERWRELLIWMTETQGMAPLPEDDEAVVLQYLAEQFGSD